MWFFLPYCIYNDLSINVIPQVFYDVSRPAEQNGHYVLANIVEVVFYCSHNYSAFGLNAARGKTGLQYLHGHAHCFSRGQHIRNKVFARFKFLPYNIHATRKTISDYVPNVHARGKSPFNKLGNARLTYHSFIHTFVTLGYPPLDNILLD